ncbi:unnamed protein product [Adineta steineri]|uniref:Nuclear receptor domain-containing protein n=1 Tax=Adineta steineri TaxID=433720 RepID=A0A819MF76_9BILA|nr:unnamed protein product [Adineta steineri]CAF3979724.1 unnamed protein product [Adineta steineri]
MSTNNSINLSERCLVCDDKNCRINYGVRCCDSCKIFFRRNIHIDLNINQCKFQGKCPITKINRHQCRYCRLKKCLFIGMNKNFLRSQHKNQQKFSSEIFNDRSLLTIEQWSMIINIINNYNNKNPIKYIHNIISNQLNYQPKIRFKIANKNLMNIIQSMYVFIESFIKIIPEFVNMNINNQIILIRRNLRNLGGFNSIFIMYETNIFNDITYSNCLLSTYGSWLCNQINKIIQRIDNDGNLIKLLLVILTFSTCSDIVSFEDNQNLYNNSTTINHILINTKHIFKIQNIYTEIMFKYMLYQYGYDQATLRFASLIQNFLYQSILTANTTKISKHESMIQTIINKTERLLALED